MLDQHFPHVLGRDGGIDRLLRVFEKLRRRLAEGRVLLLRLLDHRAQGIKYGGQIGLELSDRLAELRDLGPLIGEEQVEQMFEPVDRANRAARDLVAVLDQDGVAAVLEDNVVARIPAPEFCGDLLVEIVFLVLGLPITEGQAQIVDQRAIDDAPITILTG